MTTNALQAEIPTELMMAESSDIAQVGTDTFHFQTLTNRFSCGSVPPEYVCFPPWIYGIKESSLHATDSPEQGDSQFIYAYVVTEKARECDNKKG